MLKRAILVITILLCLIQFAAASFPPPVVDFTANETIVCTYDVIQFTDASTYYGTPNFFWEFGDSQDSHSENPTHYYDTAGTYDVYHSVMDEWGTGFSDKENYITVRDCFTADFTSNKTCQIGKPMNVSFASNCAEPDKSHWIFGDGNTSDLQNDVVTYTEYGSYTVTHTCKDSDTLVTLTETKTDYISVGVNGTSCYYPPMGCSSSSVATPLSPVIPIIGIMILYGATLYKRKKSW